MFYALCSMFSLTSVTILQQKHQRSFDNCKAMVYHLSIVGAWLSPVEHSVRDAEVGGSNPLAPTTNHRFGGDFLFLGF